MRMRAHHKLFLSYTVLLVALIIALTFGVEATLREPLLRQATEELQRELGLGLELLDLSPDADPDSLARHLAAITSHRVTIIREDGVVLGESGVPAGETPNVENHGDRPEVRMALEEGIGTAVRRSATVDLDLLYGAARTDDGSILRFAAGIDQVDAAVARVRRQILLVGAVALLFSGALSFAFSVAFTRPLRRMRDLAASIGGENVAARIRSSSKDEFGEIGTALDALSSELERRLGQLEREQEEMNALIDSMAEGVLAFDADGLLRRANPAARSIFSLTGEVEGLSPEEVARRKAFLDLVDLALEGTAVQPTELTHNGQHLVATAEPLPRGGAVLVFLDTSELRRLEGVRRDFVANASHELKTPLTVIRGHAETLLDEDLPPELRRQFGDSLRANAERLQTILDDLLDLSRIESGGWKIQAEPLRLEEVVRESWGHAKAAASDKRIDLGTGIAGDADLVQADHEALRHIFSNLFSNALRYTPEGGRVEVSARRVPDGWVEVEVRDNGTGIAAPHLSRIFERFYRADPARSRSEGGTGLGLSIVRHLVERHGGRVGAESTLGRGTTIRFTLPAGSR
jgi:two-component system, OmpR family, phosphate regulon sensor histidine kinase PhoR